MNVSNMPGMNGPGTSTGGMNSALAVAAAAAAQLNLNLNYQQQQAAAAAVVAANAGPGSSIGANQNNLTIGDLAANINTQGSQLVSDACLFCNKPLSNLNDFNKKMHLENCKIRKSLEGNVTPKSKKDDPTSASSSKSNSASHLDSIDLGPQCMYCSRSFANLSNFNKRLHFEHCKVKKRKMRQSMPGESPTPTTPNPSTPPNHQQQHTSHQSMYTNQNNSMLSLNASNSNTPLNLSLLTSHHNHHHHHGHQHPQSSQPAQLNNHHHSLFKQPSSSNFHTSNANSFAGVNNNNTTAASQQSAAAAAAANTGEFGDTCLFCARSLLNLSNFNKRVHIETCKIKQLKKETANRLKQINKTIKKKPVVKKDKPSMNSL